MAGSRFGSLRARGRLWSSEEFSLQRSLSDKVLGGEEVPPLSRELSGSCWRCPLRALCAARPALLGAGLGAAELSVHAAPLCCSEEAARMPAHPLPTPCRARTVPLEGEGCAPLPGAVLSAL